MLIAQLSDVHVGGARYRPELLRTAIAEINAAAAGSPVVEQPGIEQDPVAFPNGVTRPHMPFITRRLGLIKVSSPVAWLSQLWLLRRW